MDLVRLFVLLAIILILQWVFLAWVFGRGLALSIFWLVLVLGIVQVIGDHWGVSPEWIVFVDFTLVTATVGYWSWASDAMPSWNTLFAVTAMIGMVAIGLVGYEQGYPDVWVARMDGLLLFVLCLATFIRAIMKGE